MHKNRTHDRPITRRGGCVQAEDKVETGSHSSFARWPYRALVLASLVAPALLFAVVTWQSYQATLSAATSEVSRTTEMVSEQARSLLTMHQLVAERVSDALRGRSWDDIASSDPLHQYLARLRDEYPEVQPIWLADASGRVRNASETLPASPVTVADRDYFQALRDKDVGTYIGRMVQAKVMKGLNFNVARRREASGGDFDGVVIVTVFQSFFVDFWQTLTQSQDAVFGLYRTDGTLLARLPPADVERTVLAADSPTMQALTSGSEGAYRAESTVDGIDRIVGLQRIPAFNVFVAHGNGRRAILDAWLRTTLAYAAFFGAAAVSLMVLSLITMRRARQETRATTEWRQTAWHLQQKEAEVFRLNKDLSQRAKELEAANKELESFAFSVSHDLRAPLRAIDGFSHALQEDYADKLDVEAQRLIRVVRDGVAKMARLIDDILAFSRAARSEMAASIIDMTGLVQATLNDLASAMAGRAIDVKVAPLPQMRGDREMMQRVWMNLLDNTIKFTGHKERALIEVGSYPEAGNTVYFVQDNGAGFDMAYVDKLFGVFQRLHGPEEFPGTGAGLAIVKRIVGRHGGRVWAEGKVGEGATLYFVLPPPEPAHV
jgi:two-component system sensor kinase